MSAARQPANLTSFKIIRVDGVHILGSIVVKQMTGERRKEKIIAAD